MDIRALFCRKCKTCGKNFNPHPIIEEVTRPMFEGDPIDECTPCALARYGEDCLAPHVARDRALFRVLLAHGQNEDGGYPLGIPAIKKKPYCTCAVCQGAWKEEG